MPEENIDTNGGEGNGSTGEGQVGAGGTETENTPDLRGFESLDDLLSDYDTVKTSVDELKGLKDRMGNELGELRSEAVRLQGMVEAFQQTGTGSGEGAGEKLPSRAEVDRQFNDGEITFSQAMDMRDRILQAEIQNAVKQTEENIRSSLDEEARINQFINDNPGYVEAFNAGKLDDYMRQGLHASEAYLKYVAESKESRIAELEAEINKIKEQAQQEGIQKGVALEQGKQNAGRVLDGGGGSFSQGDAGAKKFSGRDRIQAAKERLQQMQA